VELPLPVEQAMTAPRVDGFGAIVQEAQAKMMSLTPHRPSLLGFVARCAVALMVALAPPALASEGTVAVKVQEAGAELAAGRFAAAKSVFSDLLANPDVTGDKRASVLNDRGVALWRLGELKAAIDDFNAAIGLVPEFSLAYNNRGNVLLALNNAPEAIKDFDRALLLAPTYVGALNNRAIARMQMGQAVPAIADFEKAAELAPTSPAPFNGKGRALLTMGRPFAAMRDFDRALAIEPSYRPGLRNRISVRSDLELYAGALEDLAEALAIAPDDVPLLMMRARINSRLRKPLAALKDLTRILELQPDNAAALSERGAMYARLVEPASAQQDLDRALELDPKRALTYAYRASLQRAREPDVGLADIERALKLDPNNATVLRVRGELAEALKRPDAAVADYRKAVAVDPSEVEAWTGIERLTGEKRPEPALIAVSDVEGWSVFKSAAGRFSARNVKYEKMDVPLEVLGSDPPQLTDWSIRKDFKGIGVLRFLAGKVPGKDNRDDEVEMAAVVDLWRGEIVSIVPWRQGQTAAQWTWGEAGRLMVKSSEGSQVLTLRSVRAASDRVASAPRTSGGGQSASNGQRRTTVARRENPPAQEPRRQKPKSLFQLLFNF
jgi:tetratricopeptide (TPR) repeat protein